MPEVKKVETEPIAGKWYVKLVKTVDRIVPTSPHALELKEAKMKKLYENALNDVHIKENELRNVELNYEESSKIYKKTYSAWKKALNKKNVIEKAYKHPDLVEATSFIGMDIDYYQITKAAIFMMIMGLVIVSLIFMPIIMLESDYASTLVPMTTMGYLAMLLIIMMLSYFLIIYPVYLAKRLRVYMMGRAPELVNFLAMSMALVPSLDRAISFAAENIDEPLSSRMKKILWDVYSRTYSSIEESFISFAFETGRWSDDLKRSLYTIRMSTLESTQEGVLRNLEKAKDIVLIGTKRRIEEFAASLSTPTTMLFALGVLLPMIIGSMLPMITLFGSGSNLFNVSAATSSPTTTSFSSPQATTSSGGTLSNLIMIVVVMDVIFPLIAFVYGYYILGKRPGTQLLSEIPPPYKKEQQIGFLIMSIAIGALIALVALPLSLGYAGSLGVTFSSLPVLAGVSATISYYIWLTSNYQYKKRQEMLKVEEEFPDALFQVGSRMLEGMSIENALMKTSESMQGTNIGDLFNKIVFTLQVSGKPIEEALFGDGGLLENYPSKTIKVTMKTVIKLISKENIMAGKTIIEIANYLRDLKKVDSDINKELSGVVGMMRGTAAFFAPLILGITASLYVLLSKVISGISSASLIPVGQFTMVLGIYLILLVLVIGYYVEGVEFGEVWIERKMFIATTLPIAISLFIIAAVAGQLTLGSIT
ncbi:MAG: type II secretion system F family protein [Thermoplasmata archaeon]